VDTTGRFLLTAVVLIGSVVLCDLSAFSQVLDYGSLLGRRRGGEITFEPVE